MNQVQNIIYDLSALAFEDKQAKFGREDEDEDEDEDYNDEDKDKDVKPIVYQNFKLDKYFSCETKSSDFLNDEDRELRICMILTQFRLQQISERLLKPVNPTDTQGFIYAYYSDDYPGCFKIGRTRVLPTVRIRDQEKTNNKKYMTKQAFFCGLHMLVEKCIHLELKEFNCSDIDCTKQGYTEWFRHDWDFLEGVIKNVIRAVKFLQFYDLLLY